MPVFLSAIGRMAVRMVWRRPRLVHLNITQRGSTARALVMVMIARAGHTPVILHLHSSEYRAFVESMPGPAMWMMRWMFGSARRVVVLGDGWSRYVQDALRVAPDRVSVLPNAVPGPSTPRVGRRPGAPRVLFLGQLGARKGVPELLQALARPEVMSLGWEATLAGDGDRARFEEQAARLGIADRVRFLGWVGPSEVRAQLVDADILALPSHAEGLPLSVIEGMAYGLAIVATPVGAVPEVVRHGETGLLVPAGDVAELASALSLVIADASLRTRLAGGARSRWERAHDIAEYAQQMSALYDVVAPGR